MAIHPIHKSLRKNVTLKIRKLLKKPMEHLRKKGPSKNNLGARNDDNFGTHCTPASRSSGMSPFVTVVCDDTRKHLGNWPVEGEIKKVTARKNLHRTERECLEAVAGGSLSLNRFSYLRKPKRSDSVGRGRLLVPNNRR